MPKPLYAILLDGGFITKKLYQKLDRHATPADVVSECQRLQALPQLADYELLRIYWYDALPSSQRVKQPVTNSALNLPSTTRFRQSQSFYDQMILQPHFALRMGHVSA